MNHIVEHIRKVETVSRIGTVQQFFGLIVESNGPDAFLGELCEIYSASSPEPIHAEVVGLKNGRVLLMPFGDLRGISLGSEVMATGRTMDVPVSNAMLGRVLDAFGQPLDENDALPVDKNYPLYAEPINPLRRARIDTAMETGVSAIDALLTLGRGQRVGIFSGSGVGKSTLLGMMARNLDADVNVIALIGERGREVRDFIEDNLGSEGMAKSIVIVATAEQPALVRTHAAFAATAIAEFFRDQGKDVMLMMDSLTRFAMAAREIGLSIGEPPTSRGYTPSVFSALPRLLERGGNVQSGGSITALYTVLVEGDDLNDPIADSARSILDGHIVLTRELANRGYFPAIDILQSISRLMPDLQNEDEKKTVQEVITVLNDYNRARDMVELGAYREGTNDKVDRAIQLVPVIEKILRQDKLKSTTRQESIHALKSALSARQSHEARL